MVSINVEVEFLVFCIICVVPRYQQTDIFQKSVLKSKDRVDVIWKYSKT